MRWLCLIAIGACHVQADPVDEQTRFPYQHDVETGLADYETVRWETESWEFSDPEFGLYLRKTQLHKKGAAPDVIAHHTALHKTIPPIVAGDLRLSFVGDIMWIGANWSTYGDGVTQLIDGDLRAGNLETPTDPQSPDHLDLDDINAFNAPPELIDGAHLDLFQITNNHVIDVGDGGIERTAAEIAKRGLLATGVDTQAVVDVAGTKVAFLAYTWGVNQRPGVSAHELHVIPFGHLDEAVDLTPIADDAAEGKADGATLIVVMVHWGYEYEYYADPHFLQLGRDLIRAGADVVVGSGPHVVQPAEWCTVNDPIAEPDVGTCAIHTDDGVVRTAAIFHSLGDFAATPSLASPQTKVGIVGTVSFGTGGVTGLGWAPVASRSSGGGQLVVPLSEVTDEAYVAEGVRLDGLLGTGWKR